MNDAVKKFLDNKDFGIDDMLKEYQTSGAISGKTDNARKYKKKKKKKKINKDNYSERVDPDFQIYANAIKE